MADRDGGELVRNRTSLVEMRTLPRDIGMGLEKFLDDLRERAEPMCTKTKGLARGFSTFGRVFVSRGRLILLGVLRGLDDGGCLELLKGLPTELPDVDSDLTRCGKRRPWREERTPQSDSSELELRGQS